MNNYFHIIIFSPKKGGAVAGTILGWEIIKKLPSPFPRDFHPVQVNLALKSPNILHGSRNRMAFPYHIQLYRFFLTFPFSSQDLDRFHSENVINNFLAFGLKEGHILRHLLWTKNSWCTLGFQFLCIKTMLFAIKVLHEKIGSFLNVIYASQENTIYICDFDIKINRIAFSI